MHSCLAFSFLNLYRLIPFELRNAFEEWQHLFFQWHGYVGTLRCWHNGVLISKETGEIGIIEAKDGFLVVGAQQTQHKVVSRNEYRFHGQISQLQVWKKKINYRIIQGLANRCSSIPGDVLRWSDMPAGINGNVEKRNSSECLEIKDGEHWVHDLLRIAGSCDHDIMWRSYCSVHIMICKHRREKGVGCWGEERGEFTFQNGLKCPIKTSITRTVTV